MQRCMNNQKQLMQAWSLYTTDNNDNVMPNPGWAAGTMDWTSATDNTNTATLESTSTSTIASYVKVAGLFKCPADVYQSSANPGPRVRSISMNGVLGALPTVQGTYPNGRVYYGSGGAGTVKTTMNLIKPGPAQVFVLLDEHPDSINDSAFMFDPGYSPGAEAWRSLPGSFHNGAGSLSFADGHFELHKWSDSRTLRTVLYTSFTTTSVLSSADYEWMDSKMPYK